MDNPLQLWSVAYACGLISCRLSMWFVGLMFPPEVEPEHAEGGW